MSYVAFNQESPILTPEAKMMRQIPLMDPADGAPINEFMASFRSATTLANFYGFKTVEAFARDLPKDAAIVDVGARQAGLSLEVAQLRPDTTWLNVDIAYPSETTAISEINGLPGNINFLRADVLNLSEDLAAQSYDRVFSFGLLEHLSLRSESIGLQSAENLLRLVKPSGVVAVGSSAGINRGVDATKRGRAIYVSAPQSEEELHEKAQLLVAATRTSPLRGGVRQLLFKLSSH